MLVLKISFNLDSDTDYKQDIFSKILLKKYPKFIPSKKSNAVIFDLSFILLPMKIDLIKKKHSYKKIAFKAYGNNYIKMIFILPIEIVIINK